MFDKILDLVEWVGRVILGVTLLIVWILVAILAVTWGKITGQDVEVL